MSICYIKVKVKVKHYICLQDTTQTLQEKHVITVLHYLQSTTYQTTYKRQYRRTKYPFSKLIK